jgi:hypothetical protein
LAIPRFRWCCVKSAQAREREAAHQSSCVRGFDVWELIDELAWVARIQMWRRWKFECWDRITFNLVWLFVIFIAFSAVIFLRGCT